MIVSLATLGPLGKLKAPGTWGSAVGLAWWALVVQNLATPRGWIHEICFNGLVILAAIFICGAASELLKKKDPSEVILDEMVAVPLVFFLNPHLYLGTKLGFFMVLLGFGLFRFFDIVKPLGIRWIEKAPGGVGIIADDVVAALYANLCLQVIGIYFSL
ncbi:MAG: phosphatidylglycerophosphatase A [Opitutia bacterium]|nr:phosphatidylglycerophosphatase A [Opitutales bacterium]PHX69273.1 MAG: phosphatidylglycerophosphatase A [Opitutae bacterium]